MLKWKAILCILLIAFLGLITYEITHVFGTSSPVSIELPQKTNQINAGLDKTNIVSIKRQNVMNIEGWAYINGLDAAKQITYLVLKSENKQYTFKTEKMNRPDLPTALNDNEHDLENAGFKLSINSEDIESGTYEIGFYINNDSNTQYSSVQVQIIKNNDYLEFKNILNEPQNIKLKASNSDAQTNIEEVVKENGTIHIKGWMFLKDTVMKNPQVFIVLKSKDQTIILNTQSQIRNDITKTYDNNKKLNLARSGFVSNFDSNIVGDEHYKLGIYLVDGSHQSLYWSKESIGE